MRKYIVIGIVVLAVVYWKKIKSLGELAVKAIHAKRLKFSLDSFEFTNGISLTNLASGVPTKVFQKIANFSPSTFTISQINIDVFDQQGNLLAEQSNPLAEGQAIEIAPQKSTILTLSYVLSAQKLKQLAKKSGGVLRIIKRFLSRGDYGMTIVLKGFVVAEGIKIDINETMAI
jgi:Sec-independent protein translocase protein TatA